MLSEAGELGDSDEVEASSYLYTHGDNPAVHTFQVDHSPPKLRQGKKAECNLCAKAERSGVDMLIAVLKSVSTRLHGV